jgi:GNAT superfamily N-acetyltransferase
MGIEIRPSIGCDAEAIAQAHVAAWRAAYAHVVPQRFLDDPRLVSARRDGWRRKLVEQHRPDGWDRHDRVFTGLLDGRVVAFGHVGAAHGEGADGELYGFYVHPNAWATGIADALIDRCHSALADRFDHALLWVLTDNPRARRFYERNGWTCGTGDQLVEDVWTGPQMPGMPPFEVALDETQYRRPLR